MSKVGAATCAALCTSQRQVEPRRQASSPPPLVPCSAVRENGTPTWHPEATEVNEGNKGRTGRGRTVFGRLRIFVTYRVKDRLSTAVGPIGSSFVLFVAFCRLGLCFPGPSTAKPLIREPPPPVPVELLARAAHCRIPRSPPRHPIRLRVWSCSREQLTARAAPPSTRSCPRSPAGSAPTAPARSRSVPSPAPRCIRHTG